MAFKKQFWSDKIEAKLFETQPLINVVRSDFEGEAKLGNTVYVYTYEDAITVTDYDGVTPVAVQNLVPAQVSLLIDQAKSFNIRVDKIDEVQGDANAIDKFSLNAANAIGREVEDKVYAHLGDLTNDLDLTGTAMTVSNAVSIMEQLEVLLDNENVSRDRFVYVPNAVLSVLRQTNYLNVTPTVNNATGGTTDVIKFGNFEVISSSALVVNGLVYECMFGSKDAIRFVGAIQEMKHSDIVGLFGAAIQGLYVYGSAVFNPVKGGTLTIDA